jgi:Zn-dependent protease
MSFFTQFASDPAVALIYILAIVVAITFHEFAHAWTADRLGDDTPRLQGRLSLSPLAHLDIAGSLSFLIFGFGWGKPVQYNPMRLPRKVDELLVALAGPASNLLLALALNLLALPFSGTTVQFLGVMADINLTLAAFNLLPFPPLDGSSVVAYFWPEYRSPRFSQIGAIALIAILLLDSSLISDVITPVIYFFGQLTHLFGVLA